MEAVLEGRARLSGSPEGLMQAPSVVLRPPSRGGIWPLVVRRAPEHCSRDVPAALLAATDLMDVFGVGVPEPSSLPVPACHDPWSPHAIFTGFEASISIQAALAPRTETHREYLELQAGFGNF